MHDLLSLVGSSVNFCSSLLLGRRGYPTLILSGNSYLCSRVQVLHKLLFMRRKGKGDSNVDMLARPGKLISFRLFSMSQPADTASDIRTLYITFLLSFVDVSTPSGVKTSFLEHRRDTFS